MSLKLTENKSSIGSGALNDLVFTLYCRVIGQWLPTRRRSVGERLPTDRRSVGDCILNVCLWLQKVCNFLEIGRQSIGDWSAISRRLKTVSGLSATAATGRRSVANQSATCRQPVGDHQKPFYDRFGRREVSLAATKTSLRSNRPCNRLQPVGDWSPTSLQPPCNLPATTRNFGRKEVADRLQAMCDRGFTQKFLMKCSWWTVSGISIWFIFSWLKQIIQTVLYIPVKILRSALKPWWQNLETWPFMQFCSWPPVGHQWKIKAGECFIKKQWKLWFIF